MKAQNLAIPAFAIGLVALVLSGVLFAKSLGERRTLRVRSIEIIDANENPRITLALDSQGQPALKLVDSAGNVLFQAPSLVAPSGSASFEIRDFKIRKVDETSYTSYQGRGTVVAKDVAFKSRNILLFLLQKKSKKGKEPSESEIYIPLRSGVGTVETWEFADRGERFEPPEYQWTMLGYLDLQPGSLATPK